MKLVIANSQRGMTLNDMFVVIAVIALLILVGIPLMSRSRMATRVPKINCVNNLRQIELAFRVWAVDNGDRFPMAVSTSEGGAMETIMLGDVAGTFSIMSNELSAPKLLVCPTDISATDARSFALKPTNVSYFIGADVTDTNYSALLVGDRNLALDGVPMKPGLSSFTTNSLLEWTSEMHVRQGNIGLGDGSVQQVSTAKLRDALTRTGFVTNRLAIP